MEKIERIVLHIPHASPVLPFGRSGWDEGIEKEINRWTDWYTDWLFASLSLMDPRIYPIIYPFSRFFCDVERLEDDPLEAIGQGIIYERFVNLKRSISEEERVFAMRSYEEHHGRLRRAISGEETLLVDCHSFPSDLSDVDICIGVNDDSSRPDELLLEMVLERLRKKGYHTEINAPYANSVAPDCQSPYPSLMIEVNKGIYMNGDSMMDIVSAQRLRKALEEVLIATL